MKKITIFFLILINIYYVFALKVLDSNNENQKEYIISKMEDPFDFKIKFFKERINPIFIRFVNNNETTKDNKFTLAIKYITFRSDSEINLVAEKEMKIPGIVKNLSMWVDGRSTGTKILAILEDFSGTIHSISFNTKDKSSRLNFIGWKKLTARIPKYFIQKNEKSRKERKGSRLIGLKIIPEHKINYKPQYIYLSELKAYINVQEEASMKDDNW